MAKWVTEAPETRYARNGTVALAYQVIGDGPMDLLFVPGFVSNLELNWELPSYARLLTRLSSFTRLIAVDRRGTGLSDPLTSSDAPSHEAMVDDLLAVMDAAGSDQAAVFGFQEGGMLGMLMAASHPERTRALITCGTAATGKNTGDYPWQWSAEEWEPYLKDMAERWGTRDYTDELLGWTWPTARGDEAVRRRWAKYCRMSVSPTSAVALERIYSETDARDVLPAIHTPTLVLHSVLEQHEDVESAQYLASHVAGARLVELPGKDAYPWGEDADAIVAEIEEFLTGVRPALPIDRVLTTVLFTDIVGSTERVVAEGDEAWRDILERHHDAVRVLLADHRGREIDTAGDGFLATFDGPARAIRCALGINDAVGSLGLRIRAGVHTGEVELIDDNVRGIAVHIGARVSGLAEAGQVLCTSTVKDLVAGSGLAFEDAGEHELKGVPDPWHLYRVVE
jgi:class 3 adenylate cyclase